MLVCMNTDQTVRACDSSKRGASYSSGISHVVSEMPDTGFVSLILQELLSRLPRLADTRQCFLLHLTYPTPSLADRQLRNSNPVQSQLNPVDIFTIVSYTSVRIFVSD